MPEESLKQKTKKSFYWSFINQFANTGLQFVVGIVMARLLSPSDFGITAIPVIFITIANLLIDGGFGNAMVRKPELHEKDLSTAFIYSVTIGVLAYVILYFCSSLIADYYDTPVLTPLVRVSALCFLWNPLSTPQNIILKRRLDFKIPARVSITTRVVGAIIGIVLAYAGYGLWSLVIMNVVTSFLTFILTWIAVKWLPRNGWSNTSFQYLWSYGNKLVASSLLDVVYTNISPIIIGKYYSLSSLGEYNAAKKYASLPSQQGTGVIQQVTFPVLSKLQSDDVSLAIKYRKILRVSAFVIFPVMMLLAGLSRPLILLLLTEKWEACIILLQIMCFSSMWYPIHAINLNLLQVKGRSDLFLKLEIYKKVIGLAVMICTLPWGIIYFVSAGIASSLISLVLNTYYTGKLINVGFSKQMRDLTPILTLSLITFLLTVIIIHFIPDLYAQLFIGGIIGIVFYIGIALLFHFDELADVKYMLSRRK